MNIASPSKTKENTYRPLREMAKSEPASEGKGFSGEILCADIHQVIKSISLSEIDIALIIKNGRKDGKVIFKGGNIMASICGNLRDREALAEIQSWKEGYFTLYRIFDGILCHNE